MKNLEVTVEAVDEFKKKLEARGTPASMVRFGVKGGLCSGFGYVIEYDDKQPRETDTVWTVDEVTFVVDKKSAVILTGSRVIWTKTMMAQGFDFENPIEKSRCGCGASFSVS
jgi:iron-sulfur cluster assembly protein